MNILFLFYKPIIPNNGGVQRVTYTLSSYFESKGINTCYVCPFVKTSSVLLKNQFVLPDLKLCSEENKRQLLSIVKKNRIDLIINQMSYFKEAIDLLEIVRAEKVKIFTVSHIAPSADWNYFFESHYMQFKKFNLLFLRSLFNSRVFKFFVDKMAFLMYQKRYRFAVENSDKFVLLSKSYIPEVSKMLNKNQTVKLVGIPNPIPFQVHTKTEQKREVLYVGRLTVNQKRVDLLLKAWVLVSKKHDDWKLIIVGDGPDKIFLEDITKKLNIRNVLFEGRQNPIRYYQNSSIIAMTSTYEGFPMTLVEAISFGLVPVAFNSFAAIEDVIIDQNNGLLIEPFDVDKFVSGLERLMSDSKLLVNMSERCISHSKNYYIDTVGEMWIQQFNKIVACHE